MFLPMVEPLPDALPILLWAVPGTVLIRSPRLRLRSFEMADAEGVFACITPAVARFMTLEATRGAQTGQDQGDEQCMRPVRLA